MSHMIHNLLKLSMFMVSMIFSLGFSSMAISSELESDEVRELWTGKIYSSTFTVGACINPKGNVRGVLFLRLKDGKIVKYTYSGTKNAQDELTLRHHSGHTFKGKFDSDTEVSGKIKTKNGYTVKLKGKRTQNAQLDPKCQPLSL